MGVLRRLEPPRSVVYSLVGIVFSSSQKITKFFPSNALKPLIIRKWFLLAIRFNQLLIHLVLMQCRVLFTVIDVSSHVNRVRVTHLMTFSSCSTLSKILGIHLLPILPCPNLLFIFQMG